MLPLRVWEFVFNPVLCFVFCLTIIALITPFFPCDILAFMSVYLFLNVIESMSLAAIGWAMIWKYGVSFKRMFT